MAKKQLLSDEFYGNSMFARMHQRIDIFKLRYFPFAKTRNMGGRLPAVEKRYEKSRKEQQAQYADGNLPCPLCEDIANRKVLFSTKTMHIMKNDYPYYMFDDLVVKAHIMLVPKRHISQFSEFNRGEMVDYWKILQKLSDQGYNSMTRATGNHRRSVPGHLHTHLIQLHERTS